MKRILTLSIVLLCLLVVSLRGAVQFHDIWGIPSEPAKAPDYEAK
jgi:hypothetical protein